MTSRYDKETLDAIERSVQSIGNLTDSKESDPDASEASLVSLIRGLLEQQEMLAAAMGSNDDSSDSSPDSNSTLVSLMKGVLVQNATIITALSTVNTNLTNLITAQNTTNTTLSNGISVSIG